VTESGNISVNLEAPRGVHTSRVDDKGRLKVPAAIKEYLGGLDESRLFITSLDLRTVRIYPMAVWRENEKLFEDITEEAEEAEELAFLAQDLGQEVEMDSQGRLLLPAELRRMLNLENQPVYLNSYKGRVNVLGKDVYEEHRARARSKAADKLRVLEKKGFK
jgi:MraZ protein